MSSFTGVIDVYIYLCHARSYLKKLPSFYISIPEFQLSPSLVPASVVECGPSVLGLFMRSVRNWQNLPLQLNQSKKDISIGKNSVTSSPYRNFGQN